MYAKAITTYLCIGSVHTTVGPVNVYKNIRGTDLVVFVLILFPQMSNILQLKSIPLAQPQISNEILCPYYPYVDTTYT